MTKIFITSFVAILVIVSGCGGSKSSSNPESTDNPENTDTPDSPAPITPYSKENIIDIKSVSLKYETGHNGNVRHIINQIGYISEDYTLTLGVPSLNVKNITKETKAVFNCSEERKQFTYSEEVMYDFLNEKVFVNLKTPQNNYVCSFSWKGIPRGLPTTMTDSHSINLWLNNWGKIDSIFVEDGTSTCPEEVHDYRRHTGGFCNGYYLENVEVIDENNRHHKIAYKLSTKIK